jgi:hypothetical protein
MTTPTSPLPIPGGQPVHPSKKQVPPTSIANLQISKLGVDTLRSISREKPAHLPPIQARSNQTVQKAFEEFLPESTFLNLMNDVDLMRKAFALNSFGMRTTNRAEIIMIVLDENILAKAQDMRRAKQIVQENPTIIENNKQAKCQTVSDDQWEQMTEELLIMGILEPEKVEKTEAKAAKTAIEIKQTTTKQKEKAKETEKAAAPEVKPKETKGSPHKLEEALTEKAVEEKAQRERNAHKREREKREENIRIENHEIKRSRQLKENSDDELKRKE